MKIQNLILAIILYVISTAGSYAVFAKMTPKANNTVVTATPAPVASDTGLKIDPGEPKNESCPLNGEKYTATEKAAWEQKRPLTVMIENHVDARPQSGLSKADVVYEAIAEGGITRFMAVFYCGATANDVLLAPVRSARTYFMDWASEYGEYPLYVHVGGANLPGPADALGQIQKYGWGGAKGNDMNQFSIGFPTFYRDYNRLGHDVATEHTMVTSTKKLWDFAAKRGWTNLSPAKQDWTTSFKPWQFKEEASTGDGEAKSIAFDFWEGFKQYDALWNYDAASNTYLRSTGGEPHKDLNNNQQLSAKNVVVQYTPEKGPIDENKHMLYTTIGKGDALIFQDGRVIKGKWSKASRIARTVFTDAKGKEVKFSRGRIWVEVVAPKTQVSY
jgi:hypothetical protein